MSDLAAIFSPGWGAPANDVALFLHGYGSNERDLPSLAGYLPDGLAWASLRAPIEMGYGAAAWFPLSLPEEPAMDGVEAASDAIWQWVDTNLDPGVRVVPIGFSQGGCMALHLLRTRLERVPAAVALAGFVPPGQLAADDTVREALPPVFYGRGDSDPVIWPAAVERTEAWVARHTTATVRVYPGLGHSVNEAELADMRRFLASALGR